MNRKDFLQTVFTSTLAISHMNIKAFEHTVANLVATPKMPMLFVGHGSPMNAIEDNRFSRTWKGLGKKLPTPQAILVISAHWITTNTTKVTAMTSPKTIHDFGGFPKRLFQQQYPAPGAPRWAQETTKLITTTIVELDHEWGLDHGTWSVLKPMFPDADIPVYQMSIDFAKPASFHYEIGKEISALRHKGVLVIGSGNIVHNLMQLQSDITPYDWAQEFDTRITTYINDRDFQAVVDFQKLGALATQAHPTYDHFLPLLYILGATTAKDEIHYFNDAFDLGSISMRSLVVTQV